MRQTILAAFAAAALAITAATAMEPTSPDQIPPAEPQWHVMEITPDYTLYLEAQTIGRVGDTGYAWQGKFITNGRNPALVRFVIDCLTRTITNDWTIIYSRAPSLVPGIQQGPNWTHVAENAEEEELADIVCNRRPLEGEAIIGIAAAERYARIAPLGADHFALMPANPVYQYVGWVEGVGYIYADASTAFRQGDVARIWLALLNPVPEYEPPAYVHWIVYCDEIEATPDYQVAMNNQFEVVSQGIPREDLLFAPTPELASAIKAAACVEPLAIGPNVGSMDDAIVNSAMVANQQFVDEEAQRVADGYPPAFGFDLVEIHRQEPERIKMYVDKTYIEASAGSGSMWVFYSFFDGIEMTDGSKFAGFWGRETFDCTALKAQQERAYWVGYDGTILDAGLVYPNPRTFSTESLEMQMRARACFGTPMPAAEGMTHLTSESEAIFDTLATWQ